MASYVWSGPDGGNWSDPANWMPNGVPGSADSALVNLAGSYAIALDVASIGSLTLDAAGATINPAISFALAGVMDVQAGTLVVSNTITGGTIRADGGTIDYAGGTLDGVTLDGPLDLSASDAQLSIKDGITFAGVGPEQIVDTGLGANLRFDDAETLANVVITLSNGGSLSTGPTLTLAANSTLVAGGGGALIDGTLDNKGSITAITGILNDAATTINAGSIAVGNGNADNDLFDLASNTGTISVSGSETVLTVIDTVNTGIISVASGGSLATEGTLDNTGGTIMLASGAALDLQSKETFARLGTIDRNGGILTLGGTLNLAGQTLDITKGSTFDDARLYGTITGGVIKPDGGTVDYGGVTLDGPLDLSASNAQLFITGGITFTGTATEQILETGSGATLRFDDAETLANVAITLGGSNGSNCALETGPALTLAANSTLVTGGLAYIDGDSLDNKGSITAAAGALEDDANTTNEGSIAISNGDDNNNVFAGLTNTGTLTVSGHGTAVEFFALDNTGTISVGDEATLEIESSVRALGTVSFLDDVGTLSLDGVIGSASGTLQLFQRGDAIDLGGDGYSVDHDDNTITLEQNGDIVDSFALTGQDYTDASFTLTANSNGEVLTTDAPCFCAGTRILTDQGERAVEDLALGDLVVTRQGGIETLMPVRWIGRRRVMVAQHPEPEHVLPIRIARDAVAPGLPVRDLHVSPDHALYVDGLLIQARQLVNHMTITHDRSHASVTYYHVELDCHAILIADGMPCESYLDSGNRAQFDAAGNVVPLRIPTPDRAQAACAPIVTAATLVQPVWQRLAEHARAVGHAEPVRQPEAGLLPWLETEHGATLTSSQSDDRLCFALPSGCLRVRLRSRSDLPTTLAPWSDDRRRLGVAISALILHDGNWRQELALAHLADADGWWPLEAADGLAWRWTNGDGWITLPEPAQAIELTVHAIMPILSEGPASTPWQTQANAG